MKPLLFALFAACNQTPAAAPPAAAPPAAATGGRCDAAALADAAAQIEAARATWTPEAGVVPSFAPLAAEAIRTHCSSVLATGLDASLDVLLHPDRADLGLVAGARPGDATRLACADIDTLAASLETVPGDDRPAAVFDGCGFDRYAKIISRDEFVAARAETGGATMLALGEELRRASVPEATVAPLIRELVLESGQHPRPPTDVRLPVASSTATLPLDGGPVLAVSATTMHFGDLFRIPRPLDEEGLLDMLGWAFDTAGSSPERAEATRRQRLWLMIDRDVPRSRVAAIESVARRAGVQHLGRIVLVDAMPPWRGAPLDEPR